MCKEPSARKCFANTLGARVDERKISVSLWLLIAASPNCGFSLHSTAIRFFGLPIFISDPFGIFTRLSPLSGQDIHPARVASRHIFIGHAHQRVDIRSSLSHTRARAGTLWLLAQQGY